MASFCCCWGLLLGGPKPPQTVTRTRETREARCLEMLSVPVRFRPRPKSASVSWAAAPNDEDDAGSGVFSLRKKTFSSNFLRYTSQLHYKRALQKETESAAAISTVQAQPRAKRARAARGAASHPKDVLRPHSSERRSVRVPRAPSPTIWPPLGKITIL